MEGDEDELEDLDCLPRLLEDVQSVRHTLRMLTRRGAYSRAAFISLSASN